MKNDCKILLITDQRESFGDILKTIKIKFSDFEMADDITSAVQYIDSIKPELIIFYYSSVELSVKSYLSIYKDSKFILKLNYRAILMCDEDGVTKAIDACMDDLFFDYMVFKPGYDRERINLLISKSLKYISDKDEANKNNDFSRLGKKIINHGKDVIDSLSEMDNVTKDSRENLDVVSNNLQKNIKVYSSKLVSKSSDSSKSLSDIELSKAVEKFSKENVVDSINESKKVVDSALSGIRDRIKKNKEKYEEAIFELDVLCESVPKKVLMVEDNELYAEMVSTLLEKTGSYKVDNITSVQQSMLYLMKEKVDVILLDYELDDGDAGSFLEKLADIPTAIGTPIIMLTSHATTDVYNATSMMGAQAFIKKPANKEIIISKIEKLLSDE